MSKRKIARKQMSAQQKGHIANEIFDCAGDVLSGHPNNLSLPRVENLLDDPLRNIRTPEEVVKFAKGIFGNCAIYWQHPVAKAPSKPPSLRKMRLGEAILRDELIISTFGTYRWIARFVCTQKSEEEGLGGRHPRYLFATESTFTKLDARGLATLFESDPELFAVLVRKIQKATRQQTNELVETAKSAAEKQTALEKAISKINRH